jgi:hypothetical protein
MHAARELKRLGLFGAQGSTGGRSRLLGFVGLPKRATEHSTGPAACIPATLPPRRLPPLPPFGVFPVQRHGSWEGRFGRRLAFSLALAPCMEVRSRAPRVYVPAATMATMVASSATHVGRAFPSAERGRTEADLRPAIRPLNPANALAGERHPFSRRRAAAQQAASLCTIVALGQPSASSVPE